MNYFLIVSDFIMNNLQLVILSMTAMLLIALIFFISINFKLAKMNRQYKKMMRGSDGGSLEQLLFSHVEEVKQAVGKVEALSREVKHLENSSTKCVQKIGVIRFNAFEDMGSDLSFAIALLDANNNGVVISSIYGRNESRAYAKPINNGQSSYFLTEEEKSAVAQSMEMK